jgi:hypothetical protein
MDEITNGAAQLDGPEDEADLTWGHPSTLAIASLVLAFLSLQGASVFRGIVYTVGFASSSDALGDTSQSGKGYVIAGGLLTAAFALIPLVLARSGLRRVIASDGTWTGHLLRAAFGLSVLSLLLHLLSATIAITTEPTGLVFFAS